MSKLSVGEWVDLRLRIAQAQAIIAHALMSEQTIQKLRHALMAVASVLVTPPIGSNTGPVEIAKSLGMAPGAGDVGIVGAHNETGDDTGDDTGPDPAPDGESTIGVPYEPQKDPADELTMREQEVLQRASTGDTNVEIGSTLFVSANSVKTHLLRISKKLGTHTRGHAVAEGYRRGLLRRPVLRKRQPKEDPD